MSAERDALTRALVQEYAEVLARRGQWGLTAGMNTTVARALEDGARSALLHVAERLGVTDLHARAAARVERRKTEDGSTDRETDGAELS